MNDTHIMMHYWRLIKSSLVSFLPDNTTFPQAAATAVLGLGVIYAMVCISQGAWLALVLFSPGWMLLLGLLNLEAMREQLLGQALNMVHLLHVVLYWIVSALWVQVVRVWIGTPAAGKESQLFYLLLLVLVALTWTGIRSLLIVTRPPAYIAFSTAIPLWEQLLLIANEGLAIGLFAYVWSGILVRIFQPDVFTTTLNFAYSVGLSGAALLYYGGMQMMWVERGNQWLSQNQIWIQGARLFSPFVLFTASVLIASRFTERTDPRTASLLDSGDVDLAVLALVPIVWLMLFIVMVVVFISSRGLRQRFLPDALLDRLPSRIGRGFRSISDMDILLVLGLLTTFIPVYLVVLGDDAGIISTLRTVIFQRGSAFLETSEQALALLFVIPFYILAVLILLLYAIVISRPSLSAAERDQLMNRLPVGFLIVLIITLYLFAVPFTQVFTEGRLPTLSRDLGRILAFYLLIPLLLLYLHYLVLVRSPYSRGQRLWREQHAVKLENDLQSIDRRIRFLNQELAQMDTRWQVGRRDDELTALKSRVDNLHRYIQLNGERDDLNMQRLQIVSARQQLTEISETPLSVTVARLPLRIVSIGLPVLLLFQLYQWAVLNRGLREVVNNPNLTLIEFIRILMENIEF